MESKSFAPSDKFKIFKVQLSKDFKVLKIPLIYILSYFDIANFNNNSNTANNNSSTAAPLIFNHFK